MAYEGEIAALATAFCWANTSMFFAAAGRRIGSFQVNQIRIVMAVIFLVVMHTVSKGALWPVHVSWFQFKYLALSGLVGLFLGDSFYFKALVDLGPKAATLMMSLYPIFAAFAAWLWMEEVLSAQGFAGMAIALGGVALAVLGRRAKNSDTGSGRRVLQGIAFGLLGAMGQGTGYVLAKIGLLSYGASTGNAVPAKFSELSGTLVRMTVAMAALWLVAGCQYVLSRRSGRPMVLWSSFKDTKALRFTAGGAFFGPFLGVWLSLYALTHGKVGVVSTIMATIPIIAIPLTWAVHKERPRMLEIVGALITAVGVSLLFLPVFKWLGI